MAQTKAAYGQRSKKQPEKNTQALAALSQAPGNPSRFVRGGVNSGEGVNGNGGGSWDDAAGSKQHAAAGMDSTSEAAMCNALLVRGFVQSYVDFYHLTHRADPNAVEAAEGSKIVTTVEERVFIRDNLMQAESCRRQGNTHGVYKAFNRLADHYCNGKEDFRTSLFFHEKCLDIATLTTDMRAEMTANHNLGCVYQRMDKMVEARRCHERHEELAISVDSNDEITKSNVELYKVYTKLADASLQGSEEALELYHKSLDATKKSWDKAAEGEANGKIGTLLLGRGEAVKCLEFLQRQSQIAVDCGNPESRCRACSSLAIAYDMLGQSEKALVELTLVNSISEQAGDIMLQAQACKALGTLFSKIGKLQEAVDALLKHFSLLKNIMSKKGEPISAKVTPRQLDLARVYVGVAKGNLAMGSYLVSLQYDVESVLNWKVNRSALPASEVTIAAAMPPAPQVEQEEAVVVVDGEEGEGGDEQQQQEEEEGGGGGEGGGGEEEEGGSTAILEEDAAIEGEQGEEAKTS